MFEVHEDPGDAVLVAPEDEIQGAEIAVPEAAMEGCDVGEAQVIVRPAKDDEIVVNGVTLTESSLASLRAACSSYGISTSGGKKKCFGRLLNHQKGLELQTITHAAQHALDAQVRVPRAPPLPEPPSEALQDLHRLTHTPYQPWCESCVAHRARADRHPHDFSSKEGSCPTVSFDYFYTKAGEDSQDPDALVALVLCDSKTGYLWCVPMNSKNQFDLATKEVIAFWQTLGYSDVMLRCDNEPTVLQLQRLVVQARQQMGLRTQACTPSAYQHGNALAENAIQRIRGLAGSIMHGLQLKLAATVSSSHALWSWCMRHAVNPHQGLTAYEVVYGKAYNGQVCEYGEPVFEFFQGHNERQPEVAQNAVPGESGRARQFPSLQWHSTHTHEICTQGENILGNPHGVLQGVQPLLMAVQSWIWWQSRAYMSKSYCKISLFHSTHWGDTAKQFGGRGC